jgi:hypothetical protein
MIQNGKTCVHLLVLAAAGLLAAAGAAQAATPAGTPAAPPIEEMMELDEVVVHGTRLAERIEKAEDRFFKLYNELNKDDDFDINCASLPLDGDTRIESRFCTPSFFANALADMVVWNERCRGSEDAEGNYIPPPPCYTPPAAELVLASRSGELTSNVMNVIRNNPQLGDMAGELDQLHMERTRLARRYLQIKTANDEIRASQPRYVPKIR